MKTSLRQQIIVSVLSVAVFLLTLVPLELQRRIINNATTNQNVDLLIGLSLLYLVVVIMQGGLKYLMNMRRGRIAEATIRLLRHRVIAGTEREAAGDPSDEAESEGTIVSVVSAEVEPLGGFVGESISGPVLQGGILISVLGYMVWVQPMLALSAIGLIIPQLLFVPPIQKIINGKVKERIEILRDLGEAIVDRSGDDSAEEPNSPEEFTPQIEEIYRLRIQIFRWKFLMKFLVNLLAHLGTIGVISIGGWLVIQGETEIGTIVAFVSGLQRIGDPWRSMVSYFRQITDARIKYDLIRVIPEHTSS